MTDLSRLEEALRNAAAANDTAAATQLAGEIRRLMGQPQDTARAGAEMAAEGVGIPESLAISAGRMFDKTAMGLKQATLSGLQKLPLPSILDQGIKQELGEMSTQEKEKDAAFSALAERRPFSTAIGGALPYLAVPASMGILPTAGVVGAVEASQYGTPGERVTRGLLGGAGAAAGSLAGKAVGKMLAPTSPQTVTGTQSAALSAGQRLGIQPRLSEVTGSRFLSRMEDMAARTPGGAGVMDDFARANSQAINRAASKALGENADEMTPAVFAAARARITKPFEDLKKLPGTPVQLTPSVVSAADDVLRQQTKMIAQQQDAGLIDLAKNLKWAASNRGKIDGEAYQLLRSGLSEASFDASGTNKTLYGKLLKAVDDSADQSLRAGGHGGLADALKASRPQYANLLTLERGLVAEGGNVSPARLAQVLRSQNPSAFREGKGGALFDIARLGESFKPLRQGSQTYEREAASSLLDSAIKAPWAYGWANATTSPLLSAYPRFLATNPQAAVAAQRMGLLADPLARGATMGLLDAYSQ